MAATTATALDPTKFIANYHTAVSQTVDYFTAHEAKENFIAQAHTLTARLAPANSRPLEVGQMLAILARDALSLTDRVTLLAAYAENNPTLFATEHAAGFHELFAANTARLASKGVTQQDAVRRIQEQREEELRIADRMRRQSTMPPGLVNTTATSGTTDPIPVLEKLERKDSPSPSSVSTGTQTDNRWFFQRWWDYVPNFSDLPLPSFDDVLKTIRVK